MLQKHLYDEIVLFTSTIGAYLENMLFLFRKNKSNPIPNCLIKVTLIFEYIPNPV